jgi:hypothetical protein
MVAKTKINVTNGDERAKKISIKERESFLKEKKENLDDQIKRLYLQDFKIEKPVLIRKSIFLIFLIFSIIVSFLAGIGGTLFILTKEKIKIPFLKEIELKNYLPTREVFLTTEKKITVTQDLRTAELVENFKNSPKIYLKKEGVNKNSPLLEQIYSVNDIINNGFVLSNDGWLVFCKKSRFGELDLKKDYLIAIENNFFPIQNLLTDPLTETVFVKIEASNLNPSKLADQEQITFGQQVLILNSKGKINVNKISHPNYKEIKKNEDLISSTDDYNSLILLENELSQDFIGSPVINFDRSIVGFLIDKNLIRPAWQFKNLISSVLEKKKIIRPFFGLYYLNLSETLGIQNPKYKDFNVGAIVWGSPIKNSPAERAGLKNGDLITKVNDLPINQKYNLTDIIQNLKPGQLIEITFIRDGEEKKVKIPLAEK